MKVLTVHSRYAHRGGEDEVREAERDLLRAHGHIVTEYVQDNSTIQGQRPLAVGLRSLWSQQDYRCIRARIRVDRCDLVAVHNFFPLISPAVYYAAHAEGVPVVQTLHNFRLICPVALLMREGKICEECVGKAVAFPGIRHACYRHSRVLTAGVAGMTSLHRLLGTWDRKVDRYIALTDFMKKKFVSGGFAEDKIVVKPNFASDPGVGTGQGGYFLFAGRLSPEKGVATLLEAWGKINTSRELRILGSGPEEMNLRAQASSMSNVRFLGHQTRDAVQQQMGEALAVIVPSIWYEGFGLTIVEAFAKGTPVIASDLGAMAELVSSGPDGSRPGELFQAGDASQLAAILSRWDISSGLRLRARQAYEERFTPERNYRALMDIYASVCEQARRR